MAGELFFVAKCTFQPFLSLHTGGRPPTVGWPARFARQGSIVYSGRVSIISNSGQPHSLYCQVCHTTLRPPRGSHGAPHKLNLAIFSRARVFTTLNEPEQNGPGASWCSLWGGIEKHARLRNRSYALNCKKSSQ